MIFMGLKISSGLLKVFITYEHIFMMLYLKIIS